MKHLLPSLLLIVSANFCLPAMAQFPNFAPADLVLGSSDFDTPGSGAPTASTIGGTVGIAIDPVTRKLFVADLNHNRVLRFADVSTLSNGAAAEAVFGQSDFLGSGAATTRSTMRTTFGLTVDAQGRLWVADFDNNRVLMFEDAATILTGAQADLVLGQPDFTTMSEGTTASKMSGPSAVHVDEDDNLWVAESDNYRVLKFASVSTLSNGAAASVVLGQPDFITNTFTTSSEGMGSVSGVFVDSAGNLWVADEGNNRILQFANAASLTSGSAATKVLGQTGFTTSGLGTTATTLASPTALLVDAAGTLRAVDRANARVLFFRNAASKPNGAAADGVIGQPNFTSSSGSTTSRTFDNPGYGIAMDPDGALWVADTDNERILRFSPDNLAPQLVIRTKFPRSITKSRVKIKGTATDASGIEAVRGRVGKGAFSAARGTDSWKLTSRLKPGRNRIEIIATDKAGNDSIPKKLRLKRS